MKSRIQGLQFIVNTNPAPVLPYLEVVEAVIAGGVDSIQFRHKDHFTREIIKLAEQVGQLCRRHHIPYVIDDRFDIALAVGADGVHLGQDDISINTARKILGDSMIIGATACSLELALQAEQEGADYIGLGHIYPTQTKMKTYPPIGLSTLKMVSQHLKIPVLAIGGIKLHNAHDVCNHCPTGFAIVTGIADSLDPKHETQQFKQIMRAAYANRSECA